MDFSKEVGEGVVTIVKILEGFEDQLQLYFSQCLGHYFVLKMENLRGWR